MSHEIENPPLIRAKYERLRRGWGQVELARRSGLRQQLISLIETGRYTPTDRELLRLANAFAIYPPAVLLKPTVILEIELEQPA